MYERIAALAKERGITFAEIARGTGIRESVFSNIKARGGSLSMANAYKVAKYLGIEMEALVGEPTAK